MAKDRKLSKYQQIYQTLLSDIRDTPSDSESYLPSERELSLRFETDRITVRKALDILVRDGLIVKQSGRGSVILPKKPKEPVAPPSKSLAFVLPRGTLPIDRITEPFNAELFYSAGKVLKVAGYNLLYSTIGPEESLSDSIGAGGVRGIIFVSNVPDRAINEAKRMEIPAVLINRISDCLPMILEDRRLGFTEVLDTLYELDHRSIIFINGVPGHYTTETCKTTFNTFISRHADDTITGTIIPSYWTYESGKSVMEGILNATDPKPTAICTCNDMVAIGAMDAAKESGLQIPQDLSIIGFDDIDQAIRCSPRLTTVNVNTALMARLAVENIFSQMEHGIMGPIRTIVPTQFIARESIGISRVSS